MVSDKLDAFKTKAEALWYIQGLEDAQADGFNHASINIRRYKDSIEFTELQ